jgi:hypothetical protein
MTSGSLTNDDQNPDFIRSWSRKEVDRYHMISRPTALAMALVLKDGQGLFAQKGAIN